MASAAPDRVDTMTTTRPFTPDSVIDLIGHTALLRLRAFGQDTPGVELYAKADRKPKPEFFALVASASAIIFTIPKPDAMTGTSRCIRRMGLLRGDKVSMRFRRLNMECTRTKKEASIAVTRGKDE